jgi:hypothetical protein
MAAELRTCTGLVDSPGISDFLYGLCQRDNRDGDWFHH